MALKRAGVTLVAENYTTYLRQLREINRVQQEAFSPRPMKPYQDAIDSLSARLSNTSGAFRNTSNNAKTAQQAVNNLGNNFESASNITNSFRRSTMGLRDAFSNLLNQMSPVIGNTAHLSRTLTGLVSKFTLMAVAVKKVMELVNFLKLSKQVAVRNETLGVSLQELGAQAGYSAEQIELAEKLLLKQGITTKATRQSLLRLARAEISWAEATKLAAIAQGSAVVAGMDSSAAFERLIIGIQKMEPEYLDELGITLRRTEAYQKFADEVGKTAKTLTDAEKKQAILNEIYRQSEPVLGVYGKAMETVGKQQGSLVRIIEETQNNIGQLFIATEGLRTEFQTEFWKGAQSATRGLQSLVPALELVSFGIDELRNVLGGAREEGEKHRTFWDKLGEAIFNFGKGIIALAAHVGANIMVFVEETRSALGFLADIGDSIEAGEYREALGKIFSAPPTQDWTALYRKNFKQMMGEFVKEFPILLTSWEELTKEIEGTSEDLVVKIDETTAAFIRQKTELAAMASVYEQLEKIQRNYIAKSIALDKQLEKDLHNIQEQFEKSQENLKKRTDKQLMRLEDSAQEQRQKLVEEHNRRRVLDLRRFHRQLEQERARFENSQNQSLRRFNLQDRRLRAAGDVLALMRLREDFELQNLEAKENFELQQKQSKDNQNEQQRLQQKDLQLRLDELDKNIRERQQQIQDSYKEELAELIIANAEREAEIRKAHAERFQELVQARNKELSALGESLQEEQALTKEGMDAIAAEVSRIFGDQGAGDSLIQGWADRTRSLFEELVDDVKKKISDIDKAMAGVSDGAVAPTAPQMPFLPTILKRSPKSTQSTYFPQLPQAIGMAQGGSGVVTGPALFEVEPGRREAFSFVPMPAGSNSMNHGGSIGINVSGLPSGLGERLENAVIERAANTVVDELGVAITRLRRRG